MSRYGAPDPETRAWCDVVCRKSVSLDNWYMVHLVSRDTDRLIGQVSYTSYAPHLTSCRATA